MRFEETPIAGAFLVDLEPRGDERGFFARAFCAREFADHGLEPHVVNANLAHSVSAGTTRGLHYQDVQAPEAKFFRTIRGATFNVVVDMRPTSPTYRNWFGAQLDTDNRRALYIPPVCAAGYQTLTDDAEILYLASGFYSPTAERGVRQDDPAVGVAWPRQRAIVSDKDRAWPLLDA